MLRDINVLSVTRVSTCTIANKNPINSAGFSSFIRIVNVRCFTHRLRRSRMPAVSSTTLKSVIIGE